VHIRHIANFSAETLQVRRDWDYIFKVPKERNNKITKEHQSRILYPAIPLVLAT
jgi:hypothetical protein